MLRARVAWGIGTLARMAACLLAAWSLLASATALDLRDDWGRHLTLPQAPSRIVSLAPHATELLFAVGAGARVIAVDPYSDEPPAARKLPRMTGYPQVDMERLLELEPGLVVVWGPGVTRAQVDRMAALGIAVFVSEPHTLDDVAATLDAFAPLSGTPAFGREQAAMFRRRLLSIRASHAGLRPVRVFVQIWSTPLVSVNDRDLIGDAIHSCGGLNVFGDSPLVAPQLDAEAVLAARPQLILAADGTRSMRRWRELGLIGAHGTAQLVAFDAATLLRPGPRAIDALAQLCRAIDAAR